jgi:exosome complex exonuclease RRP6
LTSKLLKAATKDTPIKPPTIQGQDDIEDNWRRVVDVVDNLLEKADSALDEFSGVIKRQSPMQSGTTSPANGRVGRGADNFFHLNMIKPQNQFSTKPDNNETGPFKPLLKTKPHAKVPLQASIEGEGNE